jgi:hypothetical protein
MKPGSPIPGRQVSSIRLNDLALAQAQSSNSLVMGQNALAESFAVSRARRARHVESFEQCLPVSAPSLELSYRLLRTPHSALKAITDGEPLARLAIHFWWE